MEKKNLKGLTIRELESFVTKMDEAPFRAKQLFKWIYKGETEFENMTDLSKGLIKKLQKNSYISVIF
ncbi:MAG TPA: hypothetical protein GX534_01415 [Thermoanaerobacterales bacterium]|nr:hypothetical protein [Thermoanaerobacterales bacterium]